jgi:phage antirepressor YoqD-like protein
MYLLRSFLTSPYFVQDGGSLLKGYKVKQRSKFVLVVLSPKFFKPTPQGVYISLYYMPKSSNGLYIPSMPKQNSTSNFDISIFEIDKKKKMVNLTKMAEHFGKEIRMWYRLPSTKAFLGVLNSNVQKMHITTQRGNSGNSGTFGTREVALKLAQWISPEFEVFCIKKLDELFQTGKAELKQTTPQDPNFWLDLQNQQARAMKYLQNALAKKNKELERAKPKVLIADNIALCTNSISILQFSKLLPNTGQVRFFRWLRENKYLMEGGVNHNLPYQKEKERGYFKVIEQTFTKKGEKITNLKTLITGKGQIQIAKKYLQGFDKKTRKETLQKIKEKQNENT